MSNRTSQLAKILWDYHNIDQLLPSHADFVLAAGSHDDRVGIYAAKLVHEGIAPLLVVSGGFGKVTSSTSRQTEASRLEIALAQGVREQAVLVEDRATNTGENIVLTRELFEQHGIGASSGLIVTKPYMKRRALATALKQWPGVTWSVAGPPLSFESYPSAEVPEGRMIELMVGDLQRIKLYAEQGFQVEQPIPDEVWQAYKELTTSGFDRYVFKGLIAGVYFEFEASQMDLVGVPYLLSSDVVEKLLRCKRGMGPVP